MTDLVEAARATLCSPEYVIDALADDAGPSPDDLAEIIGRLARTGRERDVLMGLVRHAQSNK